MTEQEADQVDDSTETAEDGVADAVDDRASELTGSAGAAQTDSPAADNRGAVAQAEQHLDDANLDSDRDTLKKIQGDM
jgi:hypothetical protein